MIAPGVARVRAVLGVLLADARAHRLQTATTLAGVAVGIAVIVAIRLASVASLDQFRGTYAGLTGVATHQLTGTAPLDPVRLLSLRRAPGVERVHPVVAATIVVPPDNDTGERPLVAVEGRPGSPRTLRLVGTDPFQAGPFLQLGERAIADAAGQDLFTRLMTEPGLVAIGRATAAGFGVKAGGTLRVQVPGRRVDLRVAVLDEPRLDGGSPPFALCDIATAQELLGLGDRVLRYDLVLADDAAPLALQPGERLETAEQRGERADSLTDAFASNLMCLGMLAVLVGAFVVFSMGQFAVTRRRMLLGRLRCLGSTARDLHRALLLEAGVLGVLGGGLGLALGSLLARALVGDVTRSVGTLYGPVGGTPVPVLDGTTASLGIAVAVAASVGAIWQPARSAAATPPVAVAGQVPDDPPPPRALPLVLLAIAGLALLPTSSAVVLPSVAVLAVLLATATAIPRMLGRIVAHGHRATLLSLACGQITRTLGRTGAAAGALAMPLAMTIAVVVMVGSFRQEVMAWSQAVLGADIYVKPLWFELAPERSRLPDGLLEDARSRPGVLAVDELRTVEEATPDGSFMVAGARLDTLRLRDSLRVTDGPPIAELVELLEQGAALVSEPLARRRGLAPGAWLSLRGMHGEERVRIAGVFQDFSLDRGYALLAVDRFTSLYGEVPVRNAAILLAPGTDAEALVADLTAAHPDAVFRTVERLREEVGRAFDDTFAITYVLQAISTSLALVGVLTALLCLHLERKQELGVLRALGARLSTVGGLLLAEALIITGVAGAVAIPVGIGLAWILVDVINTRSFGWTFPMLVESSTVVGVIGLALLAGVLAALVPWVLVGRSRVATLVETRR